MEYETVVIAIEGRQLDNMTFMLLPGALEFVWDAEYEIIDGFDITKPLGNARNVRREANGEIVAEVPKHLLYLDGYPDEPAWGFSIEGTAPLNYHGAHDHSSDHHVFWLKLQRISRVPIAAAPKTVAQTLSELTVDGDWTKLDAALAPMPDYYTKAKEAFEASNSHNVMWLPNTDHDDCYTEKHMLAAWMAGVLLTFLVLFCIYYGLLR